MRTTLKAIGNPLQEVKGHDGAQDVVPTGSMFMEVILEGGKGLGTLLFDLTREETRAIEEIVKTATERYVKSLMA